MTLYAIDKDWREAFEAAINPETGEIINDEMMEKFEQLSLDRNVKVENTALMVKNLRAEAKAIKEEVAALTARARAVENHAKSLAGYLQFILAGEKFSTPKVSVSYRTSKSVALSENWRNELPEEFIRYSDPEPNKTAITEALKAGREVPGCWFEDKVSVQVR
jgi:hypothetical protein